MKQPAEYDASEVKLQIRLNADGVVAPALRAMRDSTEVVAISLHAVEGCDPGNLPGMPGAFFGLHFDGPLDDPEARKATYRNWLLSKGFQEISRGVRESLEEALVYIEVLKLGSFRTTWGEFERQWSEVRRRANRLNLPDLLASLADGLHTPLTFAGEFQSLQKVRNCLEHRNGLVTAIDAGPDNALHLILPRLKWFLQQSDREVPLVPNMRVEKDSLIGVRRESYERTFQLGERVSFVAAEFQEIAMACYFFANDVKEKLPREGPPPESLGPKGISSDSGGHLDR